MIQIDKVLIDFFKHFKGAKRITFKSLNEPRLQNNMFIPPYIVVIGQDYKIINIILTISNSGAQKQLDQEILNIMISMLQSLNSTNTNKLKGSDETIEFYGVPVFSDFGETNDIRLLGDIIDIDLTEQNRDTTTYNVSMKIKAVK